MKKEDVELLIRTAKRIEVCHDRPFDMSGLVTCIVGWIEDTAQVHDAGFVRGLLGDDDYNICYPPGWRDKRFGREQAGAMLRVYAMTGVVDWNAENKPLPYGVAAPFIKLNGDFYRELELLKRAANTIRDKEHWTRHMMACDERGETIRTHSSDAVAWCVTGAVYKNLPPRVFAEPLDQFVPQFLRYARAMYDGIIVLNDTRSHKIVMRELDGFIAAMERVANPLPEF